MNLQSFCKFIWDKDEKTFLGRSGKAWAEIGVFFIIFYAILFSYFCGMLSFFFQTLNDKVPKLTGKHSFLQGPGLAISPILPWTGGSDYTTLIFFTQSVKDKSTKHVVDTLKDNLLPYKKADEDGYAQHWLACDDTVKITHDKACLVYYDDFAKAGKCDEANNFGYTEGKPCVLLRLNKIYGWEPEPYKKGDTLPSHLSSAADTWYLSRDDHLVWVDCFGVDDIDQHKLGDDMEYFPQRGFPVKYFPYMNQRRYLAPAVFVKFNDLQPNVAIRVQCRAFAKNIKFNTKTWEGGFHFEIFFKKMN